MTHVRTPARAYDADGTHTGPGEWITLVWEANRIDPGMFTASLSTGPWWAGGSVEEYEHARVIHRTDSSVSVTSKTGHGAAVLAEAAANLGITVQEGN